MASAKTLECSSKGDKRFSALYAKLFVNKKFTTIENAYQLSKKFNIDGEIIKAKDFKQTKHWQHMGYKPVCFNVNGKDFPIEYLSCWYKSLWYKYLSHNPHLLNIINEYDNFTDCFRNKNTINCQADIIKQVRYYGLNSLYNDIKDFLNMLK